ncbi:MAG: hypothetical protein QOF63_1603, partial [Thermoanaerobaculia bacterium]|nr:hypothetical protein [Thermoanaerobaculia bacterium]
MKRLSAVLLTLLAAFLIVPSTAWCATRNVSGAAGCSDTAGNPYCTINAAILAATAGDTIQIAAGTYAGTIASFSKPLTFIGAGSSTSGTVITKAMTYTGAGPLSLSTLRISGGGTNFKVAGTGAFSGLTLTGAAFVGNGTGAHGVYVKQNGTVSNIIVTNCSFTGHGQSGMLIEPGTGTATAVDHVTVTGSTFDGNGEYGLRIDPSTTSLQVSTSNITNNAIDGLLLLNTNGATFTNLTITGNRNGILLIPLTASQSISNLTLTNLNVSNNTRFISGHYGSGLTLTGDTGAISHITITGSTFSGNGIHGIDSTGAVSQVTVDCSVIGPNVQQGIREASLPSALLTAKNLYWGCATGPNTAGCSTVTGNVAFLPFRTSASATCTPSADLGVTKTATPNPVATGGSLTYTITAVNNGPDPATGVVATDTLPAGVTFVSASSGCNASSSTVTCTIGNLAAAAQAVRTITVTAPVTAGNITNTVTIAGNETPDPNAANNSSSVTTAVQTPVTLSSVAVTPASATLNGGQTVQLTATATYSDNSTQNVTSQAAWTTSSSTIATVNAAGLVTGGAEGVATITATFSTKSGAATISVAPAEPLPPDPATVATPIDPAVVTTVFDSTSFLYSGSNPIQRGVADGTIDFIRAAVVRGAVAVRGGQPLSGVTITVAGHPEYGHTLSRADGHFDLAVNGGDILAIQYRKSGYIALDRQVSPHWNSWAIADTAVLIPYDTATIIDFTAPGMKVARGSASNDNDGVRRATLLFASGTATSMTLPDGSTRPLPTATIRATEFTIGADGPQAMPASLPPASAYTYCVELSADEAVAAEATRIDFSLPVAFYIENFLDFPVGTIVPAGFYDRTSTFWVPMENGRVVQIVTIQDGRAYLDITGDGLADDSDALIGTTIEERTQVAALYSSGQKLWRVRTSHFTPVDCNYPGGPPGGSQVPKLKEGSTGKDLKNCSQDCGSIIGVENQTLGERLPVQGTPFALYYDSGRVPGRREDSSVTIPITGSDPPVTAIDVKLHLSIAGRTLAVQHFSPNTANATYRFEWDGIDALDRKVQGTHELGVEIEYEYPVGYYQTPVDAAQSFARLSGASFSAPKPWERTINLIQRYTVPMNAPKDPVAKGIGGWTLNVHHAYDPTEHVLEPGTGGKRNAQGIGSISRIIVGKNPSTCQRNVTTSAMASDVCLNDPRAVAVAGDGTLYISDFTALYKVNTSGTLFRIPSSGQGSQDMAVEDIAIAGDGSLYLSEPTRFRVQRLQHGVLTRVAGNGQSPGGGTAGFGPGSYSGPATTVAIRPLGLSVDRSGNVLVATGDRVYEVRTSGYMQTVAGSGSRGQGGDGGPALAAPLVGPSGAFEEESGSIVVTSPDGTNIREISTDGIVHTIASGSDSSFGSGGPLDFVARVARGANGSLLAIAGLSQDIFHVDQDGARGSIAHHGTIDKDLTPALTTAFGSFRDVAMAPDGRVYIAESKGTAGLIRRLEPLMPGLKAGDTVIPSEDGSEWYVFNAVGRHLRTLDGLLQTTRYLFGYDEKDRLISITDVNGNVTTVERDAGGRPTAIVASGGQRTTLG